MILYQYGLAYQGLRPFSLFKKTKPRSLFKDPRGCYHLNCRPFDDHLIERFNGRKPDWL